MFFEGSEKKLEIYLKSSTRNLLEVSKEKWAEVASAACAKILSEIRNDHQIAFLLSESSMFITRDRIVMITCGETTLANAVAAILDLIEFSDVESLFYERKKEVFPEYQKSNFYQDVKVLRDHFSGTAYRFGDEDDHHIFLYHYGNESLDTRNDSTLEILMHGLDPEAAAIFCKGISHTKDQIAQSGVQNILPNYQVDDFIFEPQGYSLNAIRDEYYYTIHVTPQKLGSFVSFETNASLSEKEITETLGKLADIFGPNSLDVICFTKPKREVEIGCPYYLKKKVSEILPSGYEVVFHHYFRKLNKKQGAEILEID